MDDRLTEQAQLMQQLGVATISSAEGATNPYDSTSQAVRGQLAVVRMDREAAEARYAAILNGEGLGGSGVLDAAAEGVIATDSSLSAIRGNLNSRRATIVEEMNGLRPDHPIYQKDKAEIASIDGQINDLRLKAGEHLHEQLRQDVTRTRMVELQLIKELGEKTHAASTAAPKFQRAAELGPEIEGLQKAYDAVDDRIRELELESNSPGSIHVSTKALTPLGPEQSKFRIFLLALVIVSLTCAIATPVGIDLLDSRIYTPQDIEKAVGFHPLGVLVDDNEFRREVSDEYYFRLAAGVDHAVRNSGVRTFLFTSTTPGSGTTTVIRRLNEELRGFNLKTLTITASGSGEEISRSDVPARSRCWWRHAGSADLNHLLESRNKTEEIQSSPLTPLVVYDFVGDAKRREQSAPDHVARTLNQAGELCDVVLIDAKPLPISAQTEYLARLTDATVLVVQAGATTKQELERAARLLERLDVAGVAVVLNKITLDRADRAMKRDFNGYEQFLRKRRSEAAEVAAGRSETKA
jgi:hypothetical protein